MLEHRFAQLTAACTFVLLIIGGTVNPTGSSLACPEPTMICNGEILPEMTGGVLYEHGHRLAAMSVGLLQIALTVLLLRRRRGMRAVAWGTLGMVCLQGALGAVTVGYKLPWFVSTGHLLLGFSYFATLLWVAWRTRAPHADDEVAAARRAELGTTRTLIAVGVGLVFVQLLLGALVRHSEATLACIGMPECTAGAGEWFPAAWVQRLHMIHRGFGLVVGVTTIALAFMIARRARTWSGLRRVLLAAVATVIAQIVLGIYVVLTFRQVPVAVAHFAGAASLWGLWCHAWFMTGAPARAAGAGVDGQLLAPVRGVHAVP